MKEITPADIQLFLKNLRLSKTNNDSLPPPMFHTTPEDIQKIKEQLKEIKQKFAT